MNEAVYDNGLIYEIAIAKRGGVAYKRNLLEFERYLWRRRKNAKP